MSPAERLAASKRTVTPKPRRPAPIWHCRCGERRSALRLTLRDVERATGIRNSTVLSAEQGYDVTLDTARRLAEFYGATVEELWPGRIARQAKTA